MKIYILLISICLQVIATSSLRSQPLDFIPLSKTINIQGFGEIQLTGHQEDVIRIYKLSENSPSSEDETYEIKLIHTDNLKDNTGMGLSLTNSNKGVYISRVPGNTCQDYSFLIELPASSQVNFENLTWSGDIIKAQDISGEVNISSHYNNVILQNLTGPLAVKTVYGSIQCQWNQPISEAAVSLYSIYEYIDIAIPTEEKATFNLNTLYGNIFCEHDLEVKKEKLTKKCFGKTMRGTLNGGGTEITLNSTYSDIYIR